MTNFYTENLSDFGSGELEMLKDIYTAWSDHGLPDGFENLGIKPAMNTSSGYVFLVNDECQVAMLNDNRLEIYYTLPYSGQEGFLSDLIEENTPNSLHSDDAEYIFHSVEIVDFELHGDWFDFKFNF